MLCRFALRTMNFYNIPTEVIGWSRNRCQFGILASVAPVRTIRVRTC